MTLETGLIKKWLGMPYTEGEAIDMRKVDLLSDLRTPKVEKDVVDSTLLAKLENEQTSENIIVVDSSQIALDSTLNDSTQAAASAIHITFNDTTKVPEGVIEIVDYGADGNMGMDRFYAALDHANERPVRVGFFGDSFIEGDILTGWLRSMMQKTWGGKGVGYIEMGPETSGFRSTVTHRHGGWTEHQYINKRTFVKSNQGISSHYYTANGSKAWVEGAGSKYFAPNFDQTSFFFLGKKNDKIRLTTNDTTIEYNCRKNDSLQVLTYRGKRPFRKAKWEVENEDAESIFYGMSMDGDKGVSVDNLSMRGQSGTQLLSFPTSYLRSMHKYRKYDLIVLQFGLNVASEQGKNFSHYQHEMERVVRHMHEAFPEASILIVSVGDRSYKNSEGQRTTMPGIRNMALYQQNIAAQTKTAYWSLFNAMKQLGGIDSLVKIKAANLDYTHINFKGGRLVAIKLFEAIKEGKGHYDRKQAFIREKRKEIENKKEAER